MDEYFKNACEARYWLAEARKIAGYEWRKWLRDKLVVLEEKRRSPQIALRQAINQELAKQPFIQIHDPTT